MGVFDRIKGAFSREDGPYERAHRERVESAREIAGPDADDAMLVKAAVSLVCGVDIDEVSAAADLIEDLGVGDLEMMEIELLCNDLLGVKLTKDEIDRVDTPADIVAIASRKKPAKPQKGDPGGKKGVPPEKTKGPAKEDEE